MIDFNRPAIVGNELKYIQDAVAQGMLCGDGKYTKLCSEWMKKRFDVNQVFLTTSCTHALHIQISCQAAYHLRAVHGIPEGHVVWR